MRQTVIQMGGISLYLQGTLAPICLDLFMFRYIPVPTGNSDVVEIHSPVSSVYPCTYRELIQSVIN